MYRHSTVQQRAPQTCGNKPRRTDTNTTNLTVNQWVVGSSPSPGAARLKGIRYGGSPLSLPQPNKKPNNSPKSCIAPTLAVGGACEGVRP